eukprot:2742732-Karenia_brevis.AAC.1
MGQNEAFLGQVFEAAAELGNVPMLVMGDFNVDPCRSPLLRAAMETGRWVDSALVSAALGGS